MHQALHFLDPIIGLDWHIRPGVPTLLPALFVGVVGDLKDLLAGSMVLVNCLPRVQAGTAGLGWHDPPLRPGLWPDGKAEVLYGSATVLVEGKPMAYGPLPVLTCHGSAPSGAKRRQPGVMMLPTSIVIPLPFPRQVSIGGSATALVLPFLERNRKKPVLLLCKMLRKARAGRAARWARFASEKYDYLKKGADVARPE